MSLKFFFFFNNLNYIIINIIKYFYRQYKQKAEVTLKLSEAVLALKEPDEQDIPKQHKLDVTTVIQQTLGVFSHVCKFLSCTFYLLFIYFILYINQFLATNRSDVLPETEKLYM